MTSLASLDIDKLRNFISGIEECIDELKEIIKGGKQKFLGDRHRYALAEHYFRRALEGILSAGTHIVSRYPVKTKDYREIIITLGNLKIIPEKFAQKNKALAGYRNRLVHVYWEVSSEELFDTIAGHIHDLSKFCKYFLEVARHPEKFKIR